MTFRALGAAALTLSLTLAPSLSYADTIKGWTPKPPAPPAAADADNRPPKSISRGANDPAPQPARPAPAPGASVPPPPPPAAPPATAGTPSNVLLASDPAAIQRALQDAGYQADMSVDEYGDPKIVSTTSRSTYWVLFLDCTDGAGCLGLEFYIAYGYDPATAPTLEEINDFNGRFRYIRASIAENGNPRMMMDILARDGGLDQDMFLEYVRLWTAIVPDFEAMIGAG